MSRVGAMPRTSHKPGLQRGVRTIAAFVMLLWCGALAAGIRYLLLYETTAGAQHTAPAEWPATVPHARDGKLPTLVVALHPRCSCSQATLTELEQAANDFATPFNVMLLIYQPHGGGYQWNQVNIYRDVQKIFKADVVLDDDGRMAEHFGALTSGEVLYYSAEDSHAGRHLLFAGGVTGWRGMTGGNRGMDLLKAAINTVHTVRATGAPVYGCAIVASNQSPKGVTLP